VSSGARRRSKRGEEDAGSVGGSVLVGTGLSFMMQTPST
jgi:hypothetical protein